MKKIRISCIARRIFFAALMMIVITGISRAQTWNYNHEAYISVGIAGVGTMSTSSLPYDNAAMAPFQLRDGKHPFTLSAGYMFHLSQRFALGVSYTYSQYVGNLYEGSSAKLGECRCPNHIGMLNAKYDWLYLNKFRFYSHAGIGVYFQGNSKFSYNFDPASMPFITIPGDNADKKNGTAVAWKVVPIGADWLFAPHFTLFIEGGVGHTGCAMAGVRALF